MARIMEATRQAFTRLDAAILWFRQADPDFEVQPFAVMFNPHVPSEHDARYLWAHINLGMRGFFVYARNVWLVPDFRTAVLLSFRFE